MRKRKRQEKFDAPDLLDLSRRAVALDSPQLYQTLDITIANIGRYYDEYRRSYNKDFLGELSLAAQALYVMSNELAVRAGDIPSAQPARQLGFVNGR